MICCPLKSLWIFLFLFSGVFLYLDLDGEPFFDLHHSGFVIHEIGGVGKDVTPFFGGVFAGDFGDDVGTGFEFPLAEGAGLGIDDAQRQGVGCVVEIVVRIVFQ